MIFKQHAVGQQAIPLSGRYSNSQGSKKLVRIQYLLQNLKVNKRLQGCICCNAGAQLQAPLTLHCSSMLASAAVAFHLHSAAAAAVAAAEAPLLLRAVCC